MKLKGLLASLAPTVGKALGGPMGGMAVKLVADKLGISNTTDPAKLEKYLEEHPESIALLQEAEREFFLTIQEREIDLDNFKMEMQDRKHSRDIFGDDPTPKIFAIISLTGFLAYIFLVTFRGPEDTDEATMNIILVYLGGLISGISAFFFGSSNNRGQ